MQQSLSTTRPCTVTYCLAPLRLRMQWWFLGLVWRIGRGAIELGVDSPEQMNPYWRH